MVHFLAVFQKSLQSRCVWIHIVWDRLTSMETLDSNIVFLFFPLLICLRRHTGAEKECAWKRGENEGEVKDKCGGRETDRDSKKIHAPTHLPNSC